MSHALRLRSFLRLGIPLLLAAAATAFGSPAIIFKLDDLKDTDGARKGFERVYQLTLAEDIKASCGVICDSCEDNGKKDAYYALIKKWSDSGRIEIWHHGYKHAQGEFTGAPYEAQLDHLRRGSDLLKEKCGVTLRAFGAPFNANDSETTRALNAVPTLRVWMFAKPASGATQAVLNARVNMEVKTGVVSYDAFVANFTAQTNQAYMVVQGHPPYWDEHSHAEFARIVAFCKSHGCTFLTPSECAERPLSPSKKL